MTIDDDISVAAEAAQPGRATSRTLADWAAQELQELILAREYAPGEHLRIEDLAQTLDLSPMPIREALRRLESLGFVDHLPHRGARVRELSVEDLHDTYSARLALEEQAVRRAAERFSTLHAAEATRRLEIYVAALNGREPRLARRAHRDFHFALYEASGSRWLVKLINPIFENSERYRIASLPARGSVEQLEREHREILDACIAHEADAAARLMHDHLARTANVLARKLGQGDIL